MPLNLSNLPVDLDYRVGSRKLEMLKILDGSIFPFNPFRLTKSQELVDNSNSVIESRKRRLFSGLFKLFMLFKIFNT